MTSSHFKFLRRVRIHDGECGAVARALHHAAQKVALVRNEQTLISDEKAFLSQAELGKSLSSTIFERKQMSTKTSIKRLALVAVSALGFGMLSVVPARAANAEVAAGTVTTINATAATANNLNTGSAQRVFFGSTQVAQNAPQADALFITYRAAITSFPAGGFLVPTGDKDAVGGVAALTVTGEGAATESGNSVVKTLAATTAITAETKTATGTAGLGSFTFTPTVAGTYTLTIWNDQNGDNNIGAAEAQASLAITVTAPAAAVFSPSLSTALYAETDGNDVTAAESAAAATTFLKTVGDFGGIEVKLNDSTGAAWATTGVTVSATVSGNGLINITADNDIDTALGAANATLRNASLADATGDVVVIIGSDGGAGSGTVTVSATAAGATTVLGTFSFKFYTDVTTVTASQRLSIAAAGGGTLGGQTSTTYAVALTITDADGNPVRGKTPTMTTSAATIMAASGTCTASNSSGVSYCDVDSSALSSSGQSAALTFTTTNAAGTAVNSAAQTFSIGGAASSVVFTLDKSEYAPGEKATLTVTAKDSSGNAATDGQVFAANAITSNMAGVGLPNAAAVSTVNGTATVTAYAPSNAGTWTISATAPDTTTSTVSATVNGGATAAAAEAASDAALEAIDAANAATDAANLAAEAADAATVAAEEARDAADAATAAVEALAAEVATMIDGLKAQLTTLAKTVAKIAKKVRA